MQSCTHNLCYFASHCILFVEFINKRQGLIIKTCSGKELVCKLKLMQSDKDVCKANDTFLF